MSKNSYLLRSLSSANLDFLLEEERNLQVRKDLIEEMLSGEEYQWKNSIEKRIWKNVARGILKEHIAGNKSILSEACFEM